MEVETTNETARRGVSGLYATWGAVGAKLRIVRNDRADWCCLSDRSGAGKAREITIGSLGWMREDKVIS